MALSNDDLEEIKKLIPAPQIMGGGVLTSPKVQGGFRGILTEVATAGLVAGMLWLITSVSDLSTQQALLVQQNLQRGSEIEMLNSNISALRDATYPKQQALTDQSAILDRIVTLQAKQSGVLDRVTKLEKELAIIEVTMP